MERMLKALFAWLFGRFIASLRESENVEKSTYADSEMGKKRREQFLKDLKDRNRDSDDK